MILANELTAILDKKSDQYVVNIMQKLAKEQGRINVIDYPYPLQKK